MTSNTPPDIALLVTTAWDLRATVEAQLRTLTLLQRCLDEFRANGQRDALAEIARHVDAIESRVPCLHDALPQARKAIAALQTRAAASLPAL